MDVSTSITAFALSLFASPTIVCLTFGWHLSDGETMRNEVRNPATHSPIDWFRRDHSFRSTRATASFEQFSRLVGDGWIT